MRLSAVHGVRGQDQFSVHVITACLAGTSNAGSAGLDAVQSSLVEGIAVPGVHRALRVGRVPPAIEFRLPHGARAPPE